MSTKLREQAYDAFTRQLLDRQLLPGQFVSQRELAAATCMSLASIREMIPRLEAEGLVRVLAQRGLQIVGADPRLIRDAFHLREMVEVEALAHFVRVASDATIAAAADALAKVLAVAGAGRIGADLVARAQAIDWGFHDQVVESLGNALLNDLHRVNAIRIRTMMYDRVTLSPAVLVPALEEHRPILEAARRRDATAAVAALRAHLASARRRALALDET